jgi:hypothetical protein
MILPALLIFHSPAVAQVCVSVGHEAKLVRRDEAARRPDFVEFRRRLQEVVAQRNTEALLRIVHPKVKVSFDGSGGVEAFKEYYLNNQDEDFWAEFAKILSWGGSFSDSGVFVAPYVFSDWPDEFDSFECEAVVGTGVRLRARPRVTARIVAVLDYAIVQPIDADPAVPTSVEWQRVRTADGRTGYVSRSYLRSPIDHRAFFEFKEGRWWLVTYIAGD